MSSPKPPGAKNSPLFDTPFYTGALLRRAGQDRAVANQVGTTVAEKAQCEIGWVVADALMTVGKSLPPKSAAFIACFARVNGSEKQPLDAVFTLMRDTLLECAKTLSAVTGSSCKFNIDTAIPEVCKLVLRLSGDAREKLANASECEARLSELEKKSAATARVFSSEDVEKAMAAVKEREDYLEQCERKLMEKVQQQQEREVELDQKAEDIEFRARQNQKAEAESTPPAKPKTDEYRE